jgi:hypothetical protein
MRQRQNSDTQTLTAGAIIVFRRDQAKSVHGVPRSHFIFCACASFRHDISTSISAILVPVRGRAME